MNVFALELVMLKILGVIYEHYDQSHTRQKIDSLAHDYLQQGFTVVNKPTAELISFDLSGYRPDLLVRKGDINLIIEVKTKASRISVDKFQSLAQEISKHDSWSLLLVTLDDTNSSKTPTTEDDLPTWLKLENKLLQAQALIASGAIEPATLYL